MLLSYLRLSDTFGPRVLYYLTFATNEHQLGYDGPRTFANVQQLTPWVTAALIAFPVVALIGAALRAIHVPQAALRAYAACSALVEGVLGAALVVPAVFMLLLYDTAEATSAGGRHERIEIVLGSEESVHLWAAVWAGYGVAALLGVVLTLVSLQRLLAALAWPRFLSARG